ncbi:LOW QUALITY PROTEIN: uncharacterized protein PS065_000568 [Dugong dugon]
MEPGNSTQISEFLLQISEGPELQPFFGLFLSMYLITLLGNLLIILAIKSDSDLHTPMYFFPVNLSFVDIYFTSTTVPKMLVNIQMRSKVISNEGCITQIYFFVLFGGMGNFLLTVMAYECFLAICHPLHYTVIISPRFCGLLVLVSWTISVLHSLLETLMVLRLSFCTDVEILHFFCELNQVIQYACSDTFIDDTVMYFAAVLLGGSPLTGIIFSYSKIISSICVISSAQVKCKAFSTCASHLSVVSLFYCTTLEVYFSTAATHNTHAITISSVMYTVVTPMLNSFIYSLRNKDVEETLRKLLVREAGFANAVRSKYCTLYVRKMPQFSTSFDHQLIQCTFNVQVVLLIDDGNSSVKYYSSCHFLDSHTSYMEPKNHTQVSEFILLGLSEVEELQSFLLGLFLFMYLVTFIGNFLIILTIITGSLLHTPMYFFLCNLSFVDICFTSTTVPKMLLNIHTHNKAITYQGCIAQIYFFILFAELDVFLLSIMAYDRFVAICHPLHYMVIMNPRLCGLLLLSCWILSVLDSLLHSLLVLRLSFCTNLEIPHFFCEINQVIQLACSDTLLSIIEMYLATMVMGIIPLTGIVFSYSRVVSSMLRITSARGKYKAFSTCGSHLSVVSLFYGTGLGVYLSSATTQNSRASAIASVMYSIITPMLNPFIYSLRNKDVKKALKNLVEIVTLNE